MQGVRQKDAEHARQSAFRTRSKQHLESRKSMKQRGASLRQRETCRIRSTRSPCIFDIFDLVDRLLHGSLPARQAHHQDVTARRTHSFVFRAGVGSFPLPVAQRDNWCSVRFINQMHRLRSVSLLVFLYIGQVTGTALRQRLPVRRTFSRHKCFQRCTRCRPWHCQRVASQETIRSHRSSVHSPYVAPAVRPCHSAVTFGF